jgi:hypothetical protein
LPALADPCSYQCHPTAGILLATPSKHPGVAYITEKPQGMLSVKARGGPAGYAALMWDKAAHLPSGIMPSRFCRVVSLLRVSLPHLT